MGKRKSAADWRAFLRALGRSGNARLAAREAGMDVGTAYDRRIKDDGFAARWDVELAKARAASEKAKLAGGKAELVARRTKHGIKLVRAGAGRWNAKAEAAFFASLGHTGCVRAAARACGFSTTALYERRGNYPDFAERWDQVEAEALARLPGLLGAASIASLDPEVDGKGLPKVNVDQAIRISRIKGPGAPAARRGGIRSGRRVATKEETIAALAKLLNMVKRRNRKARLEAGWSEAEDGTMIPPGWVRRDDEA
jgi:hypothetical protein